MPKPPSPTTSPTGWARVFDLIEAAADAAERLGFNPGSTTTPDDDAAATPPAERSTHSPGGPTDDQAL